MVTFDTVLDVVIRAMNMCNVRNNVTLLVADIMLLIIPSLVRQMVLLQVEALSSPTLVARYHLASNLSSVRVGECEDFKRDTK